MANKPSIPKGTRDFSPEEMVRRNYIFDTIRSVFKKYGYQPIETPAMENIESLTGKYGDEGDQLLFKILNSRPHEAKDADKQKMRDAFEKTLQQSVNNADLTEKALRYDLTVPFARYVVQHQNDITFPFKRYQIQPVWRGDRPAKGRYREFFQCDADVIGSNSLINEVEIVQMIDEVFASLNVPVKINISNRKVIAGIAQIVGEPNKAVELAVALDKYEKIGDEIFVELKEKGFEEASISKTREVVAIANEIIEKSKQGDSNYGFIRLKELFLNSEIGQKGVEEIQTVFDYLKRTSSAHNPLLNSELVFNLVLARGLNYYTGAIFEVNVNDPRSTFTSSICGGGRYDDLTGVFGLKNMSGVGISFGIDRIFDVLNEVGYPEDLNTKEGTRLLFFNNGGKSETLSLQLLKKVREQNIAAEIYPDKAKWEKQAKYVDTKKIPFTATVSEEGAISLKYQSNGKWNTEEVSFDQLIHKIK